MAEQAPVSLPIPLLAAPPIGLSVSLILLSAAAWGTKNDSLSAIMLAVGALGLILSVLTAVVVVPVGIYSLVANPANRTTGQVLAIGGSFLVVGFFALAMTLTMTFGGI